MEEKNSLFKPKKDREAPKQDARANAFLTILISGILGFVGGIVAVRFSPDLVTSTTSEDVTRVVIKEGEIIADIVDQAAKSVVSVEVTAIEQTFNPFFGTSEFEAEGAGTGIILDEDGFIVTNKHVIADSTEVAVILNDGTRYDDVEIVGVEPFNDVAYLRINNLEEKLEPAKLANSDDVRVGEQVIAIGNALGEFDTTVTSGIISGKGRPIVAGIGRDSEQLVNLFQTDASINPGNSGGPLLNILGEVIGINTAVAGNAENIGFAIPINDVKPGIESIEKNGELIRPYLGVRYITLDAEAADTYETDTEVGALIYSDDPSDAILPGGPADNAGLQHGDVIKKVNDQDVDDDLPLPNAIGQYQVGETIDVVVLRDGEEITLQVTLEAVPDDL